MSPQIRIAHVVEVCQGGVSTYLQNLISWQVEHPIFQEIHLIACENSITPELRSAQAQIHYYESSRNPLLFPRAARGILRALEKIEPDLIHLHSSFAGIYVRVFLGNYIKGIRTIYCAHGWSFTQDASWLKKLFYALIERQLAKRTDALLHISWSEYFAALRYGVRARKNVVAYLGVRDVRRSSRPAIDVEPSKINIGFLGRYDRQKGLDILTEIIRNNDFPGLAFYAIGKIVRDKSGPGSIDDAVQNLGWIEPARVDDYISQFDAIIIPSRWEGFGLVAVEAMRNAVPVLASNRGALPELIIPGFNGYIFDLDNQNQIANLLRQLHKDELKRMGINGRLVYEKHFTPSSSHQQFDKFYRSLMEQDKI